MMSVEIKDPVSALTHFVGAILSFIAATQLVSKAYYTGSVIQLIGFGVFGASLVLLYSASTVYHIVKRPRRISILLKRIDHMMIFALIAGTYTPVCLIPLGGAFGNPLGITVLAVIWSAAVIGIFLKIIWLSAPRWLCTMQYILMGWIAVFAVVPLFGKMTHMGFFWMVAGGVVYTVGAIIYATKWPRLDSRWFGFHEIFHLFVLGGSLCHYIMVLTMV